MVMVRIVGIPIQLRLISRVIITIGSVYLRVVINIRETITIIIIFVSIRVIAIILIIIIVIITVMIYVFTKSVSIICRFLFVRAIDLTKTRSDAFVS